MPSILNSDDGVVSGTSGLKSTGGNDGLLNIQSNGSTVVAMTGSGVSVTGTLTASGATTLSGAVSASSLSVNSNNISAANSLGFRNRIINGDMRIDQRNAGASVTPTTLYSQYTLDRWTFNGSQASKASVQQNAASVTPPAGFVNYLGITSLSAYSVAASDFFAIQQFIEGTNFADLGFGTANARTVTLSFWVRSSLTGTFGGNLANSANSRNYVFSYTISAANTWEFKTVTIAGDTTGTWLTNTGIGLQVVFSIGSGSNFTDTAGAWYGSARYAPTGQVSVVGTNGATFYITGVQLEVGSVATPFERRPYGTELALCQRYYARINATAAYTSFGCALAYGSTNAYAHVNFPVPMRAAPSVSQSNTAYGDITTTTSPVTSLGTAYIGKETGLIQLGFSGGGATTNRAGFWQANNNSAAYVDYSSEL